MPTLDLKWLDSFVEQLPTSEPVPTTLFDILKVATRETTNSNLLAYYLDERNPHGLGRLFLDSLISCMHSAHSSIMLEQCASPYTVERETNNIDILIQGEARDWAIILENKIFHVLNNDLGRYWDSVKAERKFGVVVSLTLRGIREIYRENFVSITHIDWLTKVKDAIAAGGKGAHSDSRHQFVFDDFFTTIMNNTQAVRNNPEYNEAIRLFQKHQSDIARLLTTQTNLQTYIQHHINAAFEKYGFVEGPKRFYYPDEKQPENQPVPPLRFFVDEQILTENKLSIYFELYGPATSMGPLIRDSTAQFQPPPGLKLDNNDSKDGGYYHLAYVLEKTVMPTHDFPARLDEIVGRFFDKGPTGVSVFDYCRQFWQQQNHKNESL